MGLPIDEIEQARIRRAKAGDKAAFGALVSKYWAEMVRAVAARRGGIDRKAKRRSRAEQNAEDATQDGFVRAWTSLRTFEEGTDFSKWLLSIILNVSSDRARHERAETVRTIDVAPAVVEAVASAAPEAEAEAKLVEAEDAARIRALYPKLKAFERLVFNLRYVHERSYEEIAAETGLTVAEVTAASERARYHLAKAGADAKKAESA